MVGYPIVYPILLQLIRTTEIEMELVKKVKTNLIVRTGKILKVDGHTFVVTQHGTLRWIPPITVDWENMGCAL